MEKNLLPKKQSKLDPQKWVERHGDYLFRFAVGRMRNTELAENLVQETFLAALKANEGFRGDSSERTWLIGILKHKIIDYLRKRYREVPVTDLISDQKAIDILFNQDGHPNAFPSQWLPNSRELLIESEFWKVFEDCLKQLPRTTALAFSLREIDKMDGKKICKILGITSTNLYTRLHRARLHLRQCLEKKWFEKMEH